MPQQSATYTIGNYTQSQALALAYGAFLEARWRPKYASADVLTGYTKITWGIPHETVTVQAEGNALTVTSKLPDTASWDLFKKNKKNLAKFSAALERAKGNATPEYFAEWQTDLLTMQEGTATTIQQQAADSAEVEKIMNLSTGTKTVTYTIIGLNLLVFIAMVVSGVSAFSPTNKALVAWGGDFKYYTVDEGQWWRLIASTFVHAGLLHLAFNMYALYMVGTYLEPMLGKLRYGVAYICTGIFASLTSLFYHGEGVVAVGASGAIFGLFGVFLALLTTRLIPKAMRQPLLQSIGIFVGYNLIYGLKGGIDNSAHLGGLLTGFVIGYLYYISLKNPERNNGNTMAGVVVAATAAVLCLVIFGS